MDDLNCFFIRQRENIVNHEPLKTQFIHMITNLDDCFKLYSNEMGNILTRITLWAPLDIDWK